MHDVDTVIIGSGAGGLAAAVALAQAGQKVLVLEQHYLPGGWCHSFSLEGFRFSPGVHYIGDLHPGGMMRKMYEGLGLGGDLEFFELNPDGFDHVVAGDQRFSIPSGRERLVEALSERFPAETRGIRSYVALVDRVAHELYDIIGATSFGDFLRAAPRTRALMIHGMRPLEKVLDARVKDPFLRCILSMQGGDYAVAAREAPFAQHAAVVGHYFHGAWYPRGGASALPRAFIRALKRAGGAIRVRTKVERVLLDTGGRRPRAIGVALADGTEIRARAVLSNADPGVTYQRLVGEEHLSRRLRKRLGRQGYSISCLSLFLGVDMDPRAAGLDSGNLWLSRTNDLEATYRYADAGGPERGEPIPAVFLTVPTLKDPTRRRDGLHTMEAFSFVSWDSFQRWASSECGGRPEDYEAFKEKVGDLMLDLIEREVPGLRKHIVFRSVGTPLTNAHYVEATRGNIYGTVKTRRNVGPFAYPLRTEVKGLYHCGASTLGHGVAGATISGLAAAAAMLHCHIDDLLTASGGEIRLRSAEDFGLGQSAAA